MARTLGIPARVQVGFTPGTATEDGTWVVTLHDAHAWPELWFEGVGWVRFEPTPGGGDGGGAPAYAPPPATNVGTSAGDVPTTTARAWSVVAVAARTPVARTTGRQVPGAAEPDRSVGRTGVTDTAATDEGSSGGWWFVVVVLLAALWRSPRLTPRAAPCGLVVDAVSSTRPTAVAAAWADVLDTATDVDLEPAPPRRRATSRVGCRGGVG